MALPITGGGPSFPHTIVDLVANDDTYLIASFNFIDIDVVFSQSIINLSDDLGDHFAGIIEKGHFIVTSDATDPSTCQAQADEYINILNFLLVG